MTTNDPMIIFEKNNLTYFDVILLCIVESWCHF